MRSPASRRVGRDRLAQTLGNGGPLERSAVVAAHLAPLRRDERDRVTHAADAVSAFRESRPPVLPEVAATAKAASHFARRDFARAAGALFDLNGEGSTHARGFLTLSGERPSFTSHVCRCTSNGTRETLAPRPALVRWPRA